MKKKGSVKAGEKGEYRNKNIRMNTHIQSPFLNADLAFGGLLDS